MDVDYSSISPAPDEAAMRQQLRRCQKNLQTVLKSEIEPEQLLREQTEDCHALHWAGGVYVWTLVLDSLTAPGLTQPSPLLQGAIDRSFGSMEGLCRTVQNAAPGQMGFVWLSSDREGELQINRTYSYATPLPLTPLLALPAALLPAPGICQRLNFSTASRRYAQVLAQRTPHLFL